MAHDMNFAAPTCPECKECSQGVPWLHSMNRVAKMRCEACGTNIQSEVGWFKHFCFAVYVNALGLIAGITVVAGFLKHSMLMVVGPIIALLVLTFPVSIWLHKRHATISRQDAALRSKVTRYGRRSNNQKLENAKSSGMTKADSTEGRRI